MEMKRVNSGCLAAVGIEGDVLEVNFRRGGRYRYFGVPHHVFAGMLQAESLGGDFNEFIRHSHYDYVKMD